MLAVRFDLGTRLVKGTARFVERRLQAEFRPGQRFLLLQAGMGQAQAGLGSLQIGLQRGDLRCAPRFPEVFHFFPRRSGARFGLGQGLCIRVGGDGEERLPRHHPAAANGVQGLQVSGLRRGEEIKIFALDIALISRHEAVYHIRQSK